MLLATELEPLRTGCVAVKASMYNMFASTPDGQLVAVNTLSGARVLLPADQRERFERALAPGTLDASLLDAASRQTLVELGFLVSADSDEPRKLRFLQGSRTSSPRSLHLIVMPTEKCNFRCHYCYESFTVGKMKPALRRAVVAHLAHRIRRLDSLHLDWFGGEPLLAFDVMGDILPDVVDLCAKSGCRLTGHITTNGSLLTAEVSRQLLDWHVTSFQVTLDGPPAEHNKRRKLHLGANAPRSTDTFDGIMANVEALLAHRRLFNLQLRTNYDLDSYPAMPGWIDELARRFGDDPRVRVDFSPIWADTCKVEVSIPIGPEKQRTHVELLGRAHRAGLATNAGEFFGLGGLVCYAAKANSLIVRANGDLAKCTVALDADHNRVGRLHPSGEIDIDLDKFVRWTSSGVEEDPVCGGCALSAACQGNACPLERLENGKRPCPPPKLHPAAVLNMTVPPIGHLQEKETLHG